MRTSQRWLEIGLIGVLLGGVACEQDRPVPLDFGEPTGEARLQMRFVYPEEGASAKPAAGDEVRVLVWHVRKLPPPEEGTMPAGKVAQLPIIDFWDRHNPNDWLAWALYLQRDRGFDRVPERNLRLIVEGNQARGIVRVIPGDKFVFVGRFSAGKLTHTGEGRVIAWPNRPNPTEVLLELYNRSGILAFDSAQLEEVVRQVVGDLLPQEVAALRALDASSQNISDLAGIEQMTGLRELNLSGNQVEDVRPLSPLAELTVLNLSENQVADVRPLASLGELAVLNLSENQVADVRPLASLEKLRILDLSVNQVEDVGALADLVGLAELDLRDNRIVDISPLEILARLTKLDLSLNQIVQVQSLATLIGLRELNLSGNQIVDVGALASLAELVVLDLSDNQIVDVGVLASLEGLTELDLSDNQIADLAPLEGLTRLVRLDVRGNPLGVVALAEQIPVLQGRGLEVLFDPSDVLPEVPDVGGGVESIADPELVAAVLKELRDNFTTDLNKVRDLNVVGKGITDLRGIQVLTRVTRLNLGGNQISDLTPLAGLDRLNQLNLSNNQITDIAALVANPGLGEGDLVDLRGNPLSEKAITEQIPALQERGVEVLFDEE